MFNLEKGKRFVREGIGDVSSVPLSRTQTRNRVIWDRKSAKRSTGIDSIRL